MIATNVFTTDLKGEDITVEVAQKYLRRHINDELPRLEQLENYYLGKHPILDRTKTKGLSNRRLVTNHAKYIADFTNAYMVGEPVTYSAEFNIEPITEVLRKSEADVQDSDLALDLAKFGRAYEIVYMSGEEAPKLKLAKMSPKAAFVVYDDTVEQKPVFGMYFHQYTNSNNDTMYSCCVATAVKELHFTLDNMYGLVGEVKEKPHYFGTVPIIEFYNNGDRMGDYEQVTTLIDAYNILQSDRVNDKEQFVNALLLIKGFTFGDTDKEKLESYNALREINVMELPAEGADAAYLTRQFDENSIETLKKSIEDDIYRISCVPNLSDQHFSGNVSGQAMKYKILALENLTKVKTRFFAEGLKYRLRCIANILRAQGAAAIDTSDINISFKRSLPANETELAQVVATLQGLVPLKDLLALLPFVPDPEKAAAEIEDEKAKEVERQQQLMMNTPIIDGATDYGEE